MDSIYNPVGIKTGGSAPRCGGGTCASRKLVTLSGVVTTVSAGSGVVGALYTRTNMPPTAIRNASEISTDPIESCRSSRETPSGCF